MEYTLTHLYTLQHIATHCNTLQHIATHLDTSSMCKDVWRAAGPIIKIKSNLIRDYKCIWGSAEEKTQVRKTIPRSMENDVSWV